MIAVIFELWPDPDKKDSYFSQAAALRSDMEAVDGFVSVERFQSLAEEDKFLSLSFFRDEAAVAAWRNSECHRTAQATGRAVLFDDYRLRIAHVIRDYGLSERAEAPSDSRIRHD